MNKYSNLSNQEISKVFAEKKGVDLIFTSAFCFSLIEKYGIEIKKVLSQDEFLSTSWMATIWINKNVATVRSTNKDLKRAILECVLIEDIQNGKS